MKRTALAELLSRATVERKHPKDSPTKVREVTITATQQLIADVREEEKALQLQAKRYARLAKLRPLDLYDICITCMELDLTFGELTERDSDGETT